MSDPVIESPQSQVGGNAAVVEVLTAATRLGLTSFGGPIAHLGYFRDEYVLRPASARDFSAVSRRGWDSRFRQPSCSCSSRTE
jgi:hypothetical protein